MRKALIIALLLVSGLLLYKCAWCDDNLLALDVNYAKEKVLSPKESIKKDDTIDKVVKAEDKTLPDDDSDKELEKMRSYRMLIQGRQKELDLIKLDLEKNSLLLKERQAQKEIYQIDKAIPGSTSKEGAFAGKSTAEGLKEEGIDPSDVKIQFLLIAGGLKEGQISLKNTLYSFKEGDIIASKLRVEKIETEGITLKEPDGAALKVNFMD